MHERRCPAHAHRGAALSRSTTPAPALLCEGLERTPRRMDGSASTACTRSTVPKGWPGAWASIAALRHRQHLRADELIMMSFEALAASGGTKSTGDAGVGGRAAARILGRMGMHTGFRARLARSPIPQRVVGSTRGGSSGQHGFCKTLGSGRAHNSGGRFFRPPGSRLWYE